MIRFGQNFRIIAALLAICVQLALPLSQARAAANGADLSTLICNPSGLPPSAEAITATQALLKAAGKDVPEAPTPPPDCERCVTPSAALPALSANLIGLHYFARPISWRLAVGDIHIASPRGPPCGTRAPPFFV